MSGWNAAHYLKYGDERTRAAEDLAARVQLASPRTVADLGCGPGNSTKLLRQRWPDAEILGLDNSPDMLREARRLEPDQKWLLADLSDWRPSTAYDLLYSNAALQWLPDHATLLSRLLSYLSPNGALAFQIPSHAYAMVRKLIHEISRDSLWNERMQPARDALTMETPEYYYDALVGNAAHLDIWETEYHHIMESQDAIVDWIASTGLRPFLETLDREDDRVAFLERLREGAREAYELRVDGKVLYPFRRTFVIAYR